MYSGIPELFKNVTGCGFFGGGAGFGGGCGGTFSASVYVTGLPWAPSLAQVFAVGSHPARACTVHRHSISGPLRGAPHSQIPWFLSSRLPQRAGGGGVKFPQVREKSWIGRYP